MPSLHFLYLAKLYLKNLLSLLLGLSLAFALIDYFQYAQKLPDSSNFKILYIFYMWQEALGLLYPLAIVFAVILTKIALVKNTSMVALHSFGYSKKELFLPFFVIAVLTYALFVFLNTTEFAYAKDKANFLLKRQLNGYNINDLFFKYNDMFVYVNRLDPVMKVLHDITLFKVKGNQVQYTMHAPSAEFYNNAWIAKDAVMKVHEYDHNNTLRRYHNEYKKSIVTLKGYKPKIIESFYQGRSLNIRDAYNSWKLLRKQHINTDKIRASWYDKVITPLFALALGLILFFRMPYYSRMVNLGYVVALSLGATFVIWGILFGLKQVGSTGTTPPELTAILPVLLLWIYALYIYLTDEKSID